MLSILRHQLSLRRLSFKTEIFLFKVKIYSFNSGGMGQKRVFTKKEKSSMLSILRHQLSLRRLSFKTEIFLFKVKIYSFNSGGMGSKGGKYFLVYLIKINKDSKKGEIDTIERRFSHIIVRFSPSARFLRRIKKKKFISKKISNLDRATSRGIYTFLSNDAPRKKKEKSFHNEFECRLFVCRRNSCWDYSSIDSWTQYDFRIDFIYLFLLFLFFLIINI